MSILPSRLFRACRPILFLGLIASCAELTAYTTPTGVPDVSTLASVAPALTGNGVIRGVVTREGLQLNQSETSPRPASARIHLEANPSIATEADSDGRFELKGVPEGTQYVVAELRTSEAPLKVRQEVRITAETPVVDVKSLVLRRSGSVVGRITLPDQATPFGADVFVAGTTIIGKTNERGAYALTELAAGDYNVTVTLPGYGRQTQLITIQAGQTTTRDFNLERLEYAATLPRIKGRVVDVKGQPVEAVIVSVTGGATTLTASDGTFRLSDIATGTVELRFYKPGHKMVSTQALVPTGAEPVAPIEVPDVQLGQVDAPAASPTAKPQTPAPTPNSTGRVEPISGVLASPPVAQSSARSQSTPAPTSVIEKSLAPPQTAVSASASHAPASPQTTISPTPNSATSTAPKTPAPEFLRSSGSVATLAGGIRGLADGTGRNAQFKSPGAIALSSTGSLYVADEDNHRIRVVTLTGEVTTLKGRTAPSLPLAEAQFTAPQGVAIDRSGNIYVLELNNRIWQVTPAGGITQFAGDGREGFRDGNGTEARFNQAKGIATDGAGNVYVADMMNNCIRKITPEGLVSTLAGDGIAGFQNGTGTAARFNQPWDVTVDADGNVLVADSHNHAIRLVTQTGNVTTLAGTGKSGTSDGQSLAATFSFPRGIAVDARNNIYVAAGTQIRAVSSLGAVTTLAGASAGYADGVGVEAQFGGSLRLATDRDGLLFVSDRGNNCIRTVR